MPAPHVDADPVTASLVDRALVAGTDDEALELLAQAAERDGFARRHPTHWDDPIPNYSRLTELHAALRLRAFDEEEAGDPRAAAETLLMAVRLGRLLKDGDSSVFDFMTGISLMEPDALHALALRHAQDLELQAWLYDELGEVALERSGARVFALDCRLTEGVFRDPPQDLMSQGILGPLLTYNPHDTVQWHRASCHADQDQLAEVWVERSNPVSPSYWDDAGLERWLHNPSGRMLLDTATPDRTSLAAREDIVLTKLAGLRAVAGLRAGLEVDLTDPMGGTFMRDDRSVTSAHHGQRLAGTEDLDWPLQ